MTSACPVPEEHLTEYFAGELPRPESDVLEEHVFSCDSCGRAFEHAGRLAARLRGLVQIVIGRERLDRMIAQGQTIRVTPVPPGGKVTVEFGKDVDYLVHALRADVAGLAQVDVELLAPDGTLLMALSHVPVDAERGEVLIACQHHYMGVFPSRSWLRVYAVDEGRRWEIGEYVVDHVVP